MYLQKNLSITSFILLSCQTVGMLNTGVNAEAPSIRSPMLDEERMRSGQKNEVRSLAWVERSWALAATDMCPCRKRQTMSHIVNSCSQSKLERKAKERKSIYIAPFCTKVHTKRSGSITQFYLQTTPCLPFLRGIHQMSPPQQLRQRTSNCSSLLIHRPRKDERLSWPIS